MKTRSTPDNLSILYEDNHIIAINKRAGDIVQGDQTGDMPLSEVVKQYIAKKYNKPGAVFLGVVHRLDRPTSGVIIFARTSKAVTRLNKAFAEKKTQKTYWAVVSPTPPKPEGNLLHFLKRNTKQNKSYAHIKEVPESKKASLSYKLLKKLDNFSLLEIELHTGRHHQIRAQLNKIGCSIKGDLKYGAKRSNPNGGIHLHARMLGFIHPVKKEPIEIIAPTPADAVWDACQ
ncbi:RluA family pseudouridine synthase [Aquimarina agarivorans]|uniref:RluA family pseudouridine synthase n=1 Tax=Aquimarina agarivorans TaxID=980584 RepID=UPI000248E5CF|nr:RluA family pseudouridine synthase [Aquimarina agarivorans]